MTAELILIGHGHLPWDEVTSLAEGSRAAWTDYTGFHLGPLPRTCPPASHVWTWSDDRWLRIRPDSDGTAVIGELRPPRDGDDPPSRVIARTVPTTWDPADQRATPRGDDLAGTVFHLIEVRDQQGGHAISFVHEGPLPEPLT